MKKLLLTASIIAAFNSQNLLAEQLNTISVEATKLSDVSGEEVKSADLAEALAKKIPSVSIVRRSGIANDIILRGQKKDNINILIDNAKVYGACPNRMDPPTSHVLTNTIDSIEIIQGPYDVENFGTLSGAVEITTQKPSENFQGEISLNVGSWDYRKTATTLSGGNDSIRYLVSASKETSAQYEDGNGDNFFDQIANPGLPAPVGVQYKTDDLDAYDKTMFLGKLYIDVADNQGMRLSYMANRSDDILYPSSKMDALYDDSNIYTVGYTLKNIGDYSRALDLQYYSSDVDHPMSTLYRNTSGPDGVNEKANELTTDMQGLKIKNEMDLNSNSALTIGFDSSVRNWDGSFRGEGAQFAITGLSSIPDVDTENVAVFAKIENNYDGFSVKAGARYDDTSITPSTSSALPSNDYSGLSANVMTTIQADKNTKYFVGAGKASRVPDARELYFHGAMINGMMIMNPLKGTPTLDETINYEIDFGMEKNLDNSKLKTRVFYSMLKDYIYFNSDAMLNAFENIDATIYGLEVNGSYFASDEVFFDFGLAYLRGEKDEALPGQTDTDLAEITPLKANVSANYEYSHKNMASLKIVATSAWDNFDEDNGEQAIAGYGVANFKLTHNISNDLEITFGIDNLLDKAYAASNTYKDLTLLTDGTGDVILMNEPGRYTYINGTYKF